MWFQHDSHIESMIGRLFKRANDIAIRQDVYFQPDGLARVLDRSGYHAFAIIGFYVDMHTLHAAATGAIALTRAGAAATDRETDVTRGQSQTQKQNTERDEQGFYYIAVQVHEASLLIFFIVYHNNKGRGTASIAALPNCYSERSEESASGLSFCQNADSSLRSE